MYSSGGLFKSLRKSSYARRVQQKRLKGHDKRRPEPVTDELETRFNVLGIQMLSANLHKQIFGKSVDSHDENAVEQSKAHLKKHGLWGKETPFIPDVEMKLPDLLGGNIAEHFHRLGMRYSSEYRHLADGLVGADLPPIPKRWEFSPGWTRYSPQTGVAEAVDAPLEDGLIFDVEVCLQQDGHFPTLATAASSKAWYSWCSERLISDSFSWSKEVRLADLIPMQSEDRSSNLSADRQQKSRLIVGHNVSFDRSFVREQYFVNRTKQRFLDTMALHICVSGQSGGQRMLFVAKKRKPLVMSWLDKTSLNNLADVYKLYCKGKSLSKEPRDIFVKGTMTDVRSNFQDLTIYCSRDVQATHRVLQKVLPLFFKRCPHPVTLAGMLEMSTAYLPVNRFWEHYLKEAQGTYDTLHNELRKCLSRVADDACSLQHRERYKRDPWLFDLDWSTQELKFYKKQKKKKGCDDQLEYSSEEGPVAKFITDIYATSSRLHKRRPFLPGYPKWYRNLCIRPGTVPESDWEPGAVLLSTQVRCLPKLMRLTWDGYPLYYDDDRGWGYLVPKNDCLPDSGRIPSSFPLQECLDICKKQQATIASTQTEEDPDLLYECETITEDSEMELWKKPIKSKKSKKTQAVAEGEESLGPFEVPKVEGCWFYRLPHKDGPKHNVGNPFCKDFITKFSEGVLKSHSGSQAEKALQINNMMSYWKNAHKRITSQMVVWLQKEELMSENATRNEEEEFEEGRIGAILPRLVTAGTVTRRAVEATWLTASNAYIHRVGSELKSLIQAPPGYHFVGADVDSQELWIAGILGDAHFVGLHGCTAFGWMTVQGEKSAGTDMHSQIAKSVGIKRDEAKVINYGRIYGAGVQFTQRLLMQYNHRLSPQEAREKAKVMYSLTKGVKSFPEISSDKMISHTGRRIWVGGSESHMFNKLEDIAESDTPTTPVLGCSISRALEPATVSNNFLTSRVNWVVQSSAVDFLHLMLVCMDWLMREVLQVKGRFSISIHDEVRYLVASKDRYKAALALQITNLLVRSLFAYELGMRDLPQSVAFFSCVDIDTVLRKEVTMDCKTPSNPHGLQKGYGIPHGEALDIYQIIEKVTT